MQQPMEMRAGMRSVKGKSRWRWTSRSTPATRQRMARPHPITTKPGQRAGELVVTLPPGWDLRLRRVLKQALADALPDTRERGLTSQQREARARLRRRRMQSAICQFVSDLLTADIVGREVALSTRNRFGTRRGSLREHVQAILKEVSEK
jgi:hypothetical protein